MSESGRLRSRDGPRPLWDASRGRILLWLFLGTSAIGTFFFGYHWLGSYAEGSPKPVLDPLIAEFTAAYAGIPILAAIFWLLPRYRITRETWTRYLPLYVLGLVVASVLQTTLMSLAREVLYPLAGLGGYAFGDLLYRYPMEFFLQAVFYSGVVAFLHLFMGYREARERQVDLARLETQLKRAELERLRTQLHPHFLFNTLNDVGALMYEDPDAADRMLARLSDLLRLTLSPTRTQRVALRDELEWLDLYLEMMRLRFGDRLQVRLDVEEEARDLMVPGLLLQPLVENALEHGVDAETGRTDLAIRAARRDGRLDIQVEDAGPGLTSGFDPTDGRVPVAVEPESGIGLENTRARLRYLYGDAHVFRLENRDEGGVRAIISIPAETA